jgi:hypothetical protein
MRSVKKLEWKALAIAGGMALSGAASASLMTADWTWTGDAGWQARGVVTWDSTVAFPTATGPETSAGLSNTGIDYLTVGLYRPNGEMLGAWDQIIEGVVLGYRVEATIDSALLDFATGSLLRVGDREWVQESRMTIIFGTGPGTGAALVYDRRVWDRGIASVAFDVRQPLPPEPAPEPAPVPAPAAVALVGLGLLLLPRARHRDARAARARKEAPC